MKQLDHYNPKSYIDIEMPLFETTGFLADQRRGQADKKISR